MNKKNKGFTLVEVLLVVGFIALAGIGIYTIYSKIRNSQYAAQEVRHLNVFKAGINALKSPGFKYTDVSTVLLNNARITPDSMRAIQYTLNDMSITSGFGQSVTASTVNLGGGSFNGYAIIYWAVPTEICSKMISGAEKNWAYISVNSVSVKPYNGTLDVALMATRCAQGSVQILFADV